MDLLEEYARRAAEWRARARRTKLPGQRDAMLTVSDAWQTMAERRCKHLAKLAQTEAGITRLEAQLKRPLR